MSRNLDLVAPSLVERIMHVSTVLLLLIGVVLLPIGGTHLVDGLTQESTVVSAIGRVWVSWSFGALLLAVFVAAAREVLGRLRELVSLGLSADDGPPRAHSAPSPPTTPTAS